EGTAQVYKRRAAKMAAERQHKAEMIKLAESERDALLANIPANMRIAVINDDRLPLINFEYWAKNGWLGKNATVATFKNGFAFMQQINKGVRYDVVITDLVLPDGGVAMMEDFRILDPNAIVFASSKFYPGDGDDHSARDLFNFGMDGYIWNNTNLNEGSFGYLQYLRQLNNYFYYKQKNGWGR
ncbi:MAG: response regulator, partial [Elusimicrobiaceae bacterium]|nr:response regulator [Elusimicrobiaceae bacterium]